MDQNLKNRAAFTIKRRNERQMMHSITVSELMRKWKPFALVDKVGNLTLLEDSQPYVRQERISIHEDAVRLLNYSTGVPALLRCQKCFTEDEQKEAVAKWTDSMKKLMGEQRP